MPTIFTRIINGEVPSYKIFEDDHTFAFLDIKPFNLGHTLIVPKAEVDYFMNVPEPYSSAVFQAAKKIAPALHKASGCVRVGAVIAGFEVPHFHYHLIPLFGIEDINFNKARMRSEEEMQNMHAKILQLLM